MNQNEFLSEFLSEFQLEAGEKLDQIASHLLRLERDATNPQPVREMFLAAHTIKGGAAMLHLTDVESLAHAVEDLLSSFRDGQRVLDGSSADLLFQTIDQLRALVATASADTVGAEPGARVTLLAAQLRANARGEVAPAAASPALATRQRALLVDDSPTVRELHRLLLEAAGYQVEVFEEGQAALSHALREPFGLVVTGVRNRGLGGFELLSALRANPDYRDVPIILASADADPELIRRALEGGARALVRKAGPRDERLSQVLAEIDALRAA